MAKIKDKLWIWGHEAGSHNNQYGIEGSSRMTPAEAAFYLGVSNLIMVRYENKPEPPFDQYAIALSPLKQVVWSIVGAGAFSNDIVEVRNLALHFPNICGVIMDDFFERRVTENGEKELAPYTPEQLAEIQSQLIISPHRKLDLWVVLYTHQLNLPVADHLKECDVTTLWTWRAQEIEKLEQNFKRLEEISPSGRKVLGCYMYDYGGRKPMPVHLMEKQCQIGLQWLYEGRIEGIIFLASCICDLRLEAVEWTRQWIRKVAEKE